MHQLTPTVAPPATLCPHKVGREVLEIRSKTETTSETTNQSSILYILPPPKQKANIQIASAAANELVYIVILQ